MNIHTLHFHLYLSVTKVCTGSCSEYFVSSSESISLQYTDFTFIQILDIFLSFTVPFILIVLLYLCKMVPIVMSGSLPASAGAAGGSGGPASLPEVHTEVQVAVADRK